MKKSGFTLAEVLITLAIIGVVAAMTVPALMTSTRGKEYEVGANKALSTLANAITMRIALEGVAPANFAGGLGQYLTIPPGTRQGEQAVLPTLSSTCGTNMAAFTACSATLKDGMIVHFPQGAGTAATGCGAAASGCYIVVDTNGSKGPTRTQIPVGATDPFQALTTINKANSNPGPIPAAGSESTTGTNVNSTPDVITFRVRDTVIEPGDKRTKNIMSTGNAMISQ